MRFAAAASASGLGSVGGSELQLGGDLGGGDDARAAADEAGGDVGAVERQRADEAQPARLGDVDLGEDGLGRPKGAIRAAIPGSGSAQ